MKTFLRIAALNLLMIVSAFSFALEDGQVIKDNHLIMYPNPVVNGQEVMLEMELSDQKMAHLYVFDFSGKLVMESINLRVGFGEDILQQKILLDQKGLYLVKIVIENSETHTKQSKVKKLYVI